MTTQTYQIPPVTAPVARPAGMGDQCEEYYRNPLVQEADLPLEGAPLLVRCKDQASRRLVLQNCQDVYTVKFCQHHYERLKAQIEGGRSPVEILEDQELEAHR